MLQLIKPEANYIQSYWETVDMVAKEGKYLSFTEAFSMESTALFVSTNLANNIPQLFVIDTKEDICVGWCDVVPKERGVGSLGIGLRKAYRNKGIGARVLEEIIQMSERYGYQKILLDVRALNQRAIHLYNKMGFQKVGLVTGGFQIQNRTVSEDVVQMELILKK